MKAQELCPHLTTLTKVTTGNGYVCEECMKQNRQWVHLRTCQTCGVTLCCDDSPQAHMSLHIKKSHHSVIASAEPGERWLWCYTDSSFSEY